MTNDFDRIPATDWARLAAYIDGEGCILITRCRAKHWKREQLYVSLTIANTDPRLAAWLHATFGGNSYVSKNQNPVRWSARTNWNTSCRQAINVICRCLPYFVIKREQAMVAIAFQKTLRRWGVKGAPAHVIGEQYRLRDTLIALKGTSARQNHRRHDPPVSCHLTT